MVGVAVWYAIAQANILRRSIRQARYMRAVDLEEYVNFSALINSRCDGGYIASLHVIYQSQWTTELVERLRTIGSDYHTPVTLASNPPYPSSRPLLTLEPGHTRNDRSPRQG